MKPQIKSTPLSKKIKNWLIFWGVNVFIKLLGNLPHRQSLNLGAWIGRVAWRFGGRIRRRALENLSLVYPEWSFEKRNKVAKCGAIHLGKNALECLYLKKHSRDFPKASHVRFTQGSLDTLCQALSLKRGLIYVTAHMGNWELMAKTVASVASVSVLFKPSYDPRFTQMISTFRERNNVEGISVADIGHLKKAVGVLRQGNILGVLLDQPVVKGVCIPFLGIPTLVSPVVGFFKRLTDAPIVVGYIHRVEPCQHAICIREIPVPKKIKNDQEVTKLVSLHLAHAISQHPTQWIWSLDRWRSTELNILSRTNYEKNAISIPAK